MRKMAKIIGSLIPGLGFALITFPLNGKGHELVNYISNGQRKDMIKALKELLQRWEEGTDYMTPNNN